MPRIGVPTDTERLKNPTQRAHRQGSGANPRSSHGALLLETMIEAPMCNAASQKRWALLEDLPWTGQTRWPAPAVPSSWWTCNRLRGGLTGCGPRCNDAAH